MNFPYLIWQGGGLAILGGVVTFRSQLKSHRRKEWYDSRVAELAKLERLGAYDKIRSDDSIVTMARSAARPIAASVNRYPVRGCSRLLERQVPDRDR